MVFLWCLKMVNLIDTIFKIHKCIFLWFLKITSLFIYFSIGKILEFDFGTLYFQFFIFFWVSKMYYRWCFFKKKITRDCSLSHVNSRKYRFFDFLLKYYTFFEGKHSFCLSRKYSLCLTFICIVLCVHLVGILWYFLLNLNKYARFNHIIQLIIYYILFLNYF